MYERMQKTTLRVDGMHCGSCVAAVSAALRRLPTVRVERAAMGEVSVVHDPAASPRGALVAAVERAGYRVTDGDAPAPRPAPGSGCCGSRRPHAPRPTPLRVGGHRR